MTKYAPMVLRRCRNPLGDEDAAADAMQTATNTCLNIMRSLEQRPWNREMALLHYRDGFTLEETA